MAASGAYFDQDVRGLVFRLLGEQLPDGRRSTGEVIERDGKGSAAWTRIAFPTWWHYVP